MTPNEEGKLPIDVTYKDAIRQLLQHYQELIQTIIMMGSCLTKRKTSTK